MLNASSQDLHQNYIHLFNPGYYMGVNGGINLYVAEGNNFSHGSAFSFSQNGGSIGRVEIGYDFTTIIGVRGFMGIAQHDWPDIRFLNPDGSIKVVGFGSEHITADLTVNLSNWWDGYRPTRFVSISVFGGAGLAHRDKADFPSDFISPVGRVGIQGDFPLAKELDLTVIAENNIVGDNFNGYVTGFPFDFYMAFTVGLKYHIR